MATEPWQQWEKRDIDGALVDRAKGLLPEMECTKQLVSLVSEEYQPAMTVLDVGCNAGHYLRSLHAVDVAMKYTGVDINPKSIALAKEIFGASKNARFDLRDVREGLFEGEIFDIVFCCNVILHLPDFRRPIRNLLASTRRVCFIRTLIDVRSTLAQRLQSHDFAEEKPPNDFYYMNTWAEVVVTGFISKLGWRTQYLRDEFDPSVLQKEYDGVKGGDGTRILGGMQADGSVVYNWKWLKITPA